MMRTLLVAGIFAISTLYLSGSTGDGRTSLRLPDGDFHRYPVQTLFTPEGRLVVAYRIPGAKAESSTLQLAVFNAKTERPSSTRTYDVPPAGPTKISDGLLLSGDGKAIFYVELTGNPR